ncbi:transglutaminase N-terminal domain-containing protein [Undibacterium arcticum]
MILTIRHETVYRYTAPLAYTIQQLRLSPRSEPQQRCLAWQITTAGKLHAFTDAFGNLGHMLTITGPHDEVRIEVEGVVDVSSPERGRLQDQNGLSPLLFTTPTPLTAPTANIRDFAAHYLPGTRLPTLDGVQSVRSDDLLKLADAICAAVAYQGGATVVTTSADDALLLGRGVCQDHAHLFLACCRAHHIAARYVSGYIDPGSSAHAESHAWIDAWVDDDDFFAAGSASTSRMRAS